jgi:uncharacterized protein (DUF433 family)
MTQWVHKATEAKISLEETRRLADEFHFLCRSLYYTTKEGKRKRRPQTQYVEIGDIIHFYYKRHDRHEPEPIGTYQVVQASRYPAQFGDRVEDTELVSVKETHNDIIDLLERAHRISARKGYGRDPKLGAFLGWVIERSNQETPAYPAELMGARARITLARLVHEKSPGTPPSGTRWGRITFDPNVMGGKPCIRGLRVTVGAVVGLLAAGRSIQEILTAYPYLEEADIRDALAFAAWRSQEQELPLSVA